MRIGLYGGSFNPAHAGHRHVSLLALRRLGLDRIWWIVTPGNPLKDWGELASTAERVAQARQVAAHPRIEVTSFEDEIGARYTVDTLAFLVRRCPEVNFVWVMGADNLAGFHRWRGWQTIATLMPILVVDRPGFTLTAARSRAAVRLSPYRLDERAARALPAMRPPAWLFLHGPRSSLSSTELRRSRSSPAEGRGQDPLSSAELRRSRSSSLKGR
ncbi:MAG TPA: nicotinate-nucleotide adenylyltransferase [Microvirga sp.]|nr:nicotinate-nucleotide adenylyltransferase [Microvirga sp.]